MEHNDVLEDALLAVLVATTTVVTLYVGWRAGGAARRPGGGPRQRRLDAPAAETAAVAAEDDPRRREPLGTWTRRLVSEQARSARNGAPATVVALRLGEDRGPLGRRVESELRRTVGIADSIAARCRASDVVRVTDDGIIRILLVETPEDGAQSFVDRISPGLAGEPGAGGREVVAAWASIAASRHLPAADRLAIARLRGATGGWLRSLAVRRTAEVDLATDPAAGDEGDARPDRGLPG